MIVVELVVTVHRTAASEEVLGKDLVAGEALRQVDFDQLSAFQVVCEQVFGFDLIGSEPCVEVGLVRGSNHARVFGFEPFGSEQYAEAEVVPQVMFAVVT